jgi:hypothetical protein
MLLRVRRRENRPVEAKSYFFCTEGHGAPQGAQAPAKSSGDTGRPADGEVRWSASSAPNPKRNTTA